MSKVHNLPSRNWNWSYNWLLFHGETGHDHSAHLGVVTLYHQVIEVVALYHQLIHYVHGQVLEMERVWVEHHFKLINYEVQTWAQPCTHERGLNSVLGNYDALIQAGYGKDTLQILTGTQILTQKMKYWVRYNTICCLFWSILVPYLGNAPIPKAVRVRQRLELFVNWTWN